MNQQWIFPVLFAAGFAILLIRQHIRNSAPEYIASATVVSRRTAPARVHSKYTSGWNYLVTFQAGSDTIELHVTEMEYRFLREGTAGTIRWQHENLLHFEPSS